MKKSFIPVILTFLLTLNSWGQTEQQHNFEINGTINADTGIVRLYFFNEFNSSKSDVMIARIENKKFSFSGSITEPQGVSIRVDELYRSSMFIIDKGVQTMTIDIKKSDIVPEIENQIMQHDYPQYKAFFNPMKNKWDLYFKKEDSLQAIYQYNIPQEINVKFKSEYHLLCNEDDKLLLQYSEQHHDSYYAFWRLIYLMQWGYEPIYGSIYNNISESLKSGYAGSILKAKISVGKILSLGENFPIIPCTDTNGKAFSTDIFKKNSYTLVDIWYTGCGPCRAQFSALRDLYSQYNSKGFEIVGISKDREADKKNWEEMLQSDNLIWKNYWDMNGVETLKLAIQAIPANFLVDNSGKIIAKNISMPELELFLNKNL